MDYVRLRDGTEVVIRSIRPDDGPALQSAHARLSARTRYLRFLAAKPHLNSDETSYLVDVDGRDHVAMVATPADDPERIVAVARFVRLPEDPAFAEFAIVVGDELQRAGLGVALMRRLIDAAITRGITHFRATVLAENVGIRRLLGELPGRVVGERHSGPADELDFELDRPALAA